MFIVILIIAIMCLSGCVNKNNSKSKISYLEIRMMNHCSNKHNLSITIFNEKSEKIFEKNITLESNESICTYNITKIEGEYTLVIELDDYRRQSHSIFVGEHKYHVGIAIFEDTIKISQLVA